MGRAITKIFVVEDNDYFRKFLVHNLSLNPDYQVDGFSSGKDLLKALDRDVDIITLDYRLPDFQGDELLKRIKKESPKTEVIMISEQEDIETAVDLLKLGAYDYLVKNQDLKERIHHSVLLLNKRLNLETEVEELKAEVKQKYLVDNNFIGSSAEMAKVFNLIKKASQSNITVSIAGETGTGKELVAKAIHFNSAKKDSPFVALNMAAIPTELVESELFGHEKGAFTGANNKRIGKFEEANNGTLFLDEIAELDLNIQAKLLRALQEREVTRLGANKTYSFNCRIIIASQFDLSEKVKKQEFREDLYYRLLGLPIQLPPLRERGNDIIELASFFAKEFCNENQLAQKEFSKESLKKLMHYSFPGNVRELKSIIDLACVLSDGNKIEAEDIQFKHTNLRASEGEVKSLREYNRDLVESFMKKFNNDTKAVADALKIGQTTVYRILKEARESDSN